MHHQVTSLSDFVRQENQHLNSANYREHHKPAIRESISKTNSVESFSNIKVSNIYNITIFQCNGPFIDGLEQL